MRPIGISKLIVLPGAEGETARVMCTFLTEDVVRLCEFVAPGHGWACPGAAVRGDRAGGRPRWWLVRAEQLWIERADVVEG